MTENKKKVKKRAPKGMVTLYDGLTTANKDDAILFAGKYYVMGKSIFLLYERLYPINSEEITYDYKKKTYNLKLQTSFGIVGLDDNQDYLFGDFSFDEDSCNILVDLKEKNGSFKVYKAMDLNTVKICKFSEDYNRGIFYERGSKNPLFFKKHKGAHMFNNIIEKSPFETELNQKYGIDSITNIISEGKPYTMGVEIETSSGFLPEYVYTNNLNVRCVHDGSCSGGEYVTGILYGDAGYNQLNKLCYELSKRCTVDVKCGVHAHIGNINFNKEFTVYAWALGLKVEKELFSMMPPSRSKGKFCQALPHFEDAKLTKRLLSSKNKKEYMRKMEKKYSVIFTFLSGGHRPSLNHNKKKENPSGRYTRTRYYWLNMVPCNFVKGADSGIGHTLEFRIHSGSTNYTKIRNYILICKAFVWFVENCKRDILEKNTITLQDIVKKAYPRKGNSLNKYIKTRKAFFKNMTELFHNEGEEYLASKNKTLLTNRKEQTTELCV